MNPEKDFWEAVEEIREADGRFAREAYGFLMTALGATADRLPAERLADPARRHLSGRELLEGLTALARQEFGELAGVVFAEWGVRRGEDVGAMVFQLVGADQLSARPEDTIDDFVGYDLAGALRVAGNAPSPGPR